MNITVVGTGYVGLSLSILLSQHNKVIACDVIQSKVDLINNRKSPISDKEIEEYLSKKELNLKATCNPAVAYKDPDYVVIATPTNYDAEKNYFDTSSIESVLSIAKKQCPEAVVVIKSTIPVGYTERIKKEFGIKNILFSPEFLREGHALYDNLYPSRIVVSYPVDSPALLNKAKEFAGLLHEGAIKKDVKILTPNCTEAEAIKLFANTYLALDHDLEIVPIINKIDLPAADPDRVSEEVEEVIGLDCSDAPRVSAKTGENVEAVLEKIVSYIHSPHH